MKLNRKHVCHISQNVREKYAERNLNFQFVSKEGNMKNNLPSFNSIFLSISVCPYLMIYFSFLIFLFLSVQKFQFTLSSPLFLFTFDNWASFYVLMIGFEPRTCGVGSDCSTNWATTTANFILLFLSVNSHPSIIPPKVWPDWTIFGLWATF